MTGSEPLCYFDGRIQPVSATRIAVSDIGLLRGYSVFDFGRTYRGRLFQFADNIARFRRSAAELMLEVPLDDDAIGEIARSLLKNRVGESGIKLLLTGGYAGYVPDYENPNFFMMVQDLPSHDPTQMERGLKLMSAQYQRDLPHIKSTNYLNAIRLEPLKRQRGVDDIIYHSHHGVTECPRSNFFLFNGDSLVTADQQVLEGITRKVVLRLAQRSFQIESRRVEFDELFCADEAFVTSTTRAITPVVEIDGSPIGSGRPGPRTRRLMALFAEYVEGEDW